MKCLRIFKRSLGTATRRGVDNIKLDLQKRVVRIDEGCSFHGTSVSQLRTASCDSHSRSLPATGNRTATENSCDAPPRLQQQTAI